MPAPCQGAREPLALVIAALPQALPAERDRHEVGGVARRQRDRCSHVGEIVRDARQAPVLERMHRVPGPALQPDRRADGAEGRGPRGAHPAGAEMRLGLAAPVAPRRPHGAPAMATYVTHDPARAGKGQQGVAERALRR